MYTPGLRGLPKNAHCCECAAAVHSFPPNIILAAVCGEGTQCLRQLGTPGGGEGCQGHTMWGGGIVIPWIKMFWNRTDIPHTLDSKENCQGISCLAIFVEHVSIRECDEDWGNCPQNIYRHQIQLWCSLKAPMIAAVPFNAHSSASWISWPKCGHSNHHEHKYSSFWLENLSRNF